LHSQLPDSPQALFRQAPQDRLQEQIQICLQGAFHFSGLHNAGQTEQHATSGEKGLRVLFLSISAACVATPWAAAMFHQRACKPASVARRQ